MQSPCRAREVTVSDKRDTDEQTDDIVKAHNLGFDLLLLEGEQHAELNISCNKMSVCGMPS